MHKTGNSLAVETDPGATKQYKGSWLDPWSKQQKHFTAYALLSKQTLEQAFHRRGGGLEALEASNRNQIRTTAESQWIVAARPLYHLQYRVRAKSSARFEPQ